MLQPNTTPIYSNLAGDPDFADLLQEFVQNLALRSRALKDHLQRQELEPLTRIIHQLKGACGGYGFPTLTDTAREIEEQLRSGHSLDEVRDHVELFIDSLSLATATFESTQPRNNLS